LLGILGNALIFVVIFIEPNKTKERALIFI